MQTQWPAVYPDQTAPSGAVQSDLGLLFAQTYLYQRIITGISLDTRFTSPLPMI